MNFPKPGQIGFWPDREAAMKHAREKLSSAGGKVAGPRNLQKAVEGWRRKYGDIPFSEGFKGREWLEAEAARRERVRRNRERMERGAISSRPDCGYEL